MSAGREAATSNHSAPTPVWRVLIAAAVILYGLHVGSVFFLPVVAATVLAFLFAPPFEWLVRRGVPRPLGAFLLVALFITVVAGTAYQLSQPISAWLDRMPQATQSLQRSADALSNTVGEISRTAREIGNVADSLIPEEEGTMKVQVDDSDEQKVAIAKVLSFATGLILTFLLLFFCLATGGLFLKRLVRLPRQADLRHRVINVIREVRGEISRYLFTITVINICLGIATAGILWLYGVPDFWLWGTLAAISNFVPYVGTVVTFLSICFAASFSAADPLHTLLPGLSFLLLNGLEAFLLTPALVGARLSLNPVFILLSLIFWGALWNVFGLLMAVPILAAVKLTLENWSDDTARVAMLMSGVKLRRSYRRRQQINRTASERALESNWSGNKQGVAQ